MGIFDNINKILPFQLKKKKENLYSLMFKNRDLDKINDDLVDSRIIEYLTTRTIISQKLDSLLNNNIYMREFAQISCFMDFKISESSEFSDRQKELMVEACFNQYFYIKEKIGIDIDSYLNTIDKNLLSINFVNGTETSTSYSFINDKLDISRNKENINDDKVFYKLFLHELNHCYSYSPTKFGFFEIGLTRGYGTVKSSFLNEFQTEYIQLEMTKQFFPKFVQNDNEFIIDFKNGESMQTKLNGNPGCYDELIIMSKIVNECIGDKFTKSFLSKDTNDCLKKIISKEAFELMEDVRVTYTNLDRTKNYFKQKYSLEDYLNYEDKSAKLVAKLIYENNIPMYKYEKVFDKNDRFLINENSVSSLNERFQKQVIGYLKEFENENIENFNGSAEEFKTEKFIENEFREDYKENDIQK